MKELIIYSRPRCPYTNKLKDLLNKANIPFKSIDIWEAKPEDNIFKHEDGHIPTPQVRIGNKLIWDYTTEEALVEEIKELLN